MEVRCFFSYSEGKRGCDATAIFRCSNPLTLQPEQSGDRIQCQVKHCLLERHGPQRVADSIIGLLQFCDSSAWREKTATLLAL